MEFGVIFFEDWTTEVQRGEISYPRAHRIPKVFCAQDINSFTGKQTNMDSRCAKVCRLQNSKMLYLG